MDESRSVRLERGQGIIVGDNAQQTNNFAISISLPGGERESMLFLAPPRPSGALVGRDLLLTQVKQQLIAGENISLLMLPGVGKTMLAITLAYDSEILTRFADGVLWAGMGRQPNILAHLGRWGAALGIPPHTLSKLADVDSRAAAVQESIGSRRLLIIVDDAWHEEDARWLHVGGPNCAFLITTRLPQLAREFGRNGCTVVNELSDDDGLKLLTELAPEAVKMEPDAASRLVQAADGLPLALTLIGGCLAKECYSGQPRRIRAALDRLSVAAERLKVQESQSPTSTHPDLALNTPISLMAAIHVSDESLEEPERQMLYAVSVFRPKPHAFSEEAAVAVSGAPVELLDRLTDAGLLEASESGSYMLHRVIAEYGRAQLSDEVLEQLHQRAAAYFSNRAAAVEESRHYESSYLSWYRYETPEWMDNTAAWLHHLAHGRDRASTGLAFARTYFDAFWWWGCYIEYPYCEQLLTQWTATQRRPEDQNLAASLRRFRNAYPIWHQRATSNRAEAWSEVEQALTDIRAVICPQVSNDTPPGDIDPIQRHVLAITDIFLAESFRYRPGGAASAYDAYTRSLTRMRTAVGAGENDEAWNIPWVLWHLADLSLEQGRIPDSRAYGREALDLALSPAIPFDARDCEIISNCFRVLADSASAAGEPDTACRLYGRAIFFGYAFQAIPKGIPDYYTEACYSDLIDVVVNWLLKEASTNGLEAASIQALELRKSLADYWEEVGQPDPPINLSELLERKDRDGLKEALFLAPPTTQDIESADSQYGPRAKRLYSKLGQAMSSMP